MSNQSIQRPVSPLRRRMLEDMAMRGLREETQHDYIRFVSDFAAFLGRSPDTATAEDIRRFQVQSGVQPPTINSSVSGLRFLFTVTLDRPDLSRRFILVRYPRKLPAVLSVEEAGRLFAAAPGLKHKAALGTAYGAGLRVSEVAALKVDDIDSTRMLIRVEQGKGRKDRNAMLSPQLLELLRLWWCEGKRRGLMLPHGWLFPGRSSLEPISTCAATISVAGSPTTSPSDQRRRSRRWRRRCQCAICAKRAALPCRAFQTAIRARRAISIPCSRRSSEDRRSCSFEAFEPTIRPPVG